MYAYRSSISFVLVMSFMSLMSFISFKSVTSTSALDLLAVCKLLLSRVYGKRCCERLCEGLSRCLRSDFNEAAPIV